MYASFFPDAMHTYKISSSAFFVVLLSFIFGKFVHVFLIYIRENAHALYLDKKKFHFFYVRMPFKVIWWWGTYVCGALRACMFFYIYKIHSCFFYRIYCSRTHLKNCWKKVFNIHKEAELFNCFYNNYHTKSVCVRFLLSLRPFFLFDMNKVYLCYIA